jgi:hypothetical protein
MPILHANQLMLISAHGVALPAISIPSVRSTEVEK